MRRTLCLILLLTLTALCLAGCGTQDWSYKDANKGVVRVMSGTAPLGDSQLADESLGFGSGFAVGTPGEASDLFITNRHVVVSEDGSLLPCVYLLLEDDAWGITLTDSSATVHYNSEHIARCEVLYPTQSDPEYPDLAVLRAERVITERVALPLRSGFEMAQYDKVYTLGFPGSTDDILAEYTGGRMEITRPAGLGSITVKDGIISAVKDVPTAAYTTLFLHSANINHGNSGGPLIDERGYVVGINTYGWNYTYYDQSSGSYVDTGVAENFGSLFIDYATQTLDSLGLPYSRDFQSVPTWLVLTLSGTGALVLTLLLFVLVRKRGRRKKIADTPYLIEGLSGTYAGKQLPVHGTVRFGRDPGRCSHVIPGASISALHCRLEAADGVLTLQDCRSTNGTFLNGRRLEPGHSAILRDADRFYLATPQESFAVHIRFNAAGAGERRKKA